MTADVVLFINISEMKKYIYCAIVLMSSVFSAEYLQAQSRIVRSRIVEFTPVTDTLRLVDSLIASRKPLVADSLVGKDIFAMLSSGGFMTKSVDIRQSDSVYVAMMEYIRKNGERSVSGYRLRIYFNNSQTARVDSEKAERDFILKYPQYPTYREYTNPYFKVTIGDFRTKSEALNVLKLIKGDYPAAFVVKENIFSF